MGLTNNLPQTGGDGSVILPAIKFNAKEAKMVRVDRVEQNGTWSNQESVLFHKDFPQANYASGLIFNMQNVKVGYVRTGKTVWQWDLEDASAVASGAKSYPTRSDEVNAEGKPAWKQVLTVSVTTAPDGVLGGKEYEFAPQSALVIAAFSTLYDQWLTSVESGQNQMPIVSVTGVDSSTNTHGTNYAPVFSVTGHQAWPIAKEANTAPPAAAPTVPANVMRSAPQPEAPPVPQGPAAAQVQPPAPVPPPAA